MLQKSPAKHANVVVTMTPFVVNIAPKKLAATRRANAKNVNVVLTIAPNKLSNNNGISKLHVQWMPCIAYLWIVKLL